MRCFIGIDLGSTTTKAVVIDEQQNVLGRGITNSRSNYDTAAAIAKQEALVNGRFHLFREKLSTTGALNGALDGFLAQLERDFRLEQYLEQLVDLEATCRRNLQSAKFGDATAGVEEALVEVFRRLAVEAPALFAPGAKRKSDFFRDIAGSQYLATGETVAQGGGHPLRLPAQRLRSLDHRGREPRLRRLDPPPPARRPGAGIRGAARDGEPARGRRGPDQGHPRHRHGGDLHRRHRLRPRPPAVQQGAHPLGDPLPRARRPHDVPGDGDRARHRRPGHEGDPGRPAGHRRELPDERPLRGGLRALPRLHRRRDEHGAARARAAWR